MNVNATLAATSLLLALAAPSFAHEPANLQHYDGTREQLRALCIVNRADLADRNDRTICVDGVRHISRVCIDGKGCYALSDNDTLATGGIRDAAHP